MANQPHKPFTTNKPGIPILPGRITPLIQKGPPKNVPAPAPQPAAVPAPKTPAPAPQADK
jgi:hypothetical protein